MINRSFRYLIFLILPLSVLMSINVFKAAPHQDKSKQALTFSNLSLEIASTKKGFVKLEPIPLTLSLCNKTDQMILGHGALKFSANLVKLFVNHVDGKAQEIQQLSAFPKEVSVKSVEMKPDECFQAKELLTLNLNTIFPEAGEYQIYAMLFDPNSKREVKSNISMIQIVEPYGIDRQAFEFIQANSKSADLLSGRYLSGTQKAQNILERFVMIYDTSAYGDYATFLLGELYFAQDDYDRASQQFYKLAKKADFALAHKAEKYLADAKEKQKE